MSSARVTSVGPPVAVPAGAPGVGVASVHGDGAVNTFTLTDGSSYNVPAIPTPAPTHWTERVYRPGRVEARESYVGLTNIYDRPRVVDGIHARVGVVSAAGTITVTVRLDEVPVATLTIPPGQHVATWDGEFTWPVGGVLRVSIVTAGNTADASDLAGSFRYRIA